MLQTGRVASIHRLENFGPFLVRQQPAQRCYFPHLNRVAIEPGEDAVQRRHVAVTHQYFPSVEVSDVRLTSNALA